MSNTRRIVLGIVLADFSALTAYTIYRYGALESVAMCFANAATTTLFVDACIALALIVSWMWEDARRTGRAWLPYALVTLGLGSVGPLLYLVTGRPGAAVAAPAAGQVAA